MGCFINQALLLVVGSRSRRKEIDIEAVVVKEIEVVLVVKMTAGEVVEVLAVMAVAGILVLLAVAAVLEAVEVEAVGETAVQTARKIPLQVEVAAVVLVVVVYEEVIIIIIESKSSCGSSITNTIRKFGIRSRSGRRSRRSRTLVNVVTV